MFLQKISLKLMDVVLYVGILIISVYSITNFYHKFFHYSVKEEVRTLLERSKTDFTKFYNATGFTYPQAYIAHGGGVGEFVYTNSYEAVMDSIRRGYKFIELDLIITADNIIIGGHDGVSFKNFIGCQHSDDCPVLYEEIKNKRIKGKYTVLSRKEICSIMEKYPDFYLVTDKIRDYTLLLEQIPYPERLIVEVFSYEDYRDALKAGIKYPALCLHTATINDLNNVLKYKIPMITGQACLLYHPVLYNKYKELHEKGVIISLYLRPMEGEAAYMKENMGKVFSKFYTDIGYETIIQENMQ